MRERDISDRMVEDALYNPDVIREGKKKPKLIAEKDVGFRTVLRVVIH